MRTLWIVVLAVQDRRARGDPVRGRGTQSIQRVDGGAVPNISGTKARPRAIALTVHLFFDSTPDLDRGVQFATAHGDLDPPRRG